MAARFDDWEGESLAHYGVLGMKWGVRKDPRGTYQKANAERQRRENRVIKARAAVVKASSRDIDRQEKIMQLEGRNKRSLKKIERLQQKNADGSMQKKIDKQNQKIARNNAYLEKEKSRAPSYKLQSDKANMQLNKAKYEAEKWTKQMLNVFGETSMDELHKKYGRSA